MVEIIDCSEFRMLRVAIWEISTSTYITYPLIFIFIISICDLMFVQSTNQEISDGMTVILITPYLIVAILYLYAYRYLSRVRRDLRNHLPLLNSMIRGILALSTISLFYVYIAFITVFSGAYHVAIACVIAITVIIITSLAYIGKLSTIFELSMEINRNLHSDLAWDMLDLPVQSESILRFLKLDRIQVWLAMMAMIIVLPILIIVATYSAILIYTNINEREIPSTMFKLMFQPPLNYILVSYFSMSVILLARYSQSIRGKERRAEHRSSAVWLRSFATEKVPIAGKDELFQRTTSISIDECLAWIFGQFVDIRAIGRPGEILQPLGIVREYVSESIWRQRVGELIREASFLVITPGRGSGFDWELHACAYDEKRRPLVLVASPNSDASLINALSVLSESRSYTEILTHQRGNLVYFFAVDRVIILSDIESTAASYATALLFSAMLIKKLYLDT